MTLAKRKKRPQYYGKVIKSPKPYSPPRKNPPSRSKKSYQARARELLSDKKRAQAILEMRVKQAKMRSTPARQARAKQIIVQKRRTEAFSQLQSIFEKRRQELERKAEEERRRATARANRARAAMRARATRDYNVWLRQRRRQLALMNLRRARALKRGYDDHNPWFQSSNVEMLGYDSGTNTMFVRFHHNHAEYFYYDVPEQVYEDVHMGLEWCRTTGQNQWGRWWRGKYPSLGAAVHWQLATQGYEYERIR